MAIATPPRADSPSRSKTAGRALLRRLSDRLFAGGSQLMGLIIIALILWIGARLYLDSGLTRSKFGLGILSSTSWDVPHEVYGAATFIFGTLVSSLVGLVIAIPVGVGAALFLTEVAPKWVATPISFIIELLAAVPSIIYGFWALNVLCPFLQTHVNSWLSDQLGANPLFGGPPVLSNVLAAGLILAIMIVPFITAVSREVIRTVPVRLREASMGLGSTRWETIKNVVLPSAKAGISGACILGLGRAIGETMAVVMVIGNSIHIPESILKPAYTMSGLLANEFNEAYTEPLHRSALLEIALILFVITLVVNVFARLMISAAKGDASGARSGGILMAALGRMVSGAATVLGRFGFVGGLAIFAVAQVTFDFRRYGVASLDREFELALVATLALWGVFRAVSFGRLKLRKALDAGARATFTLSGALACFVLGAVLYYVAVHGMKGITPSLFTHLPTPAGIPGGGLKNAIVGTVELVLIASLVGIPIGLLAGVYVSEFASGRLGAAVRFAADVLNGIPSVVIGLFAYAAFVLPFGHFSGWSGGLSLAVIMIPTVARTCEDMLRLVPDSFREASLGLGATKVQTIRRVVFPAAKAGIVTGIMLGIARIAGETAPLLFTAFGNDLLTVNPSQPVSSLTLKVYWYAMSPYDDWVQQAWAGALVLLLFVLVLSLTARIVISRSKMHAFH